MIGGMARVLGRTNVRGPGWARRAVFAGVSVSALMIGSAALAQSAGGAASQSQGANNSSTSVGEVIVTAERRSENLQNVPLAVDSVSGADLQRSTFTSLTDIQFLTPSVQFQSGVSPEYQIRGVGTQTFDYGIEQSVGVFIDDVVQALPRSPDLGTLADVNQIQVLEGPQGDLFGKNTSAGAIVVTTTRPSFDSFEDIGHFTYGSRNEIVAQDTVNIPVNDTLALRFTGGYIHRDGFVDNLYTDQKLYAHDDGTFRAKLLWKPTNKLEIYLIGDYETHWDNGSSVWTVRSYGQGDAGVVYVPTNFIQQQLTSYGVVAGPQNIQGAWDGPIGDSSRTATGQMEINYHFDNGLTLTSITAYSDYRYKVALEVDSTPLPVFDTNNGFIHSHQFTQELRLTSPTGGRFEYVAGLYFFDLVNNPGQLQGGTFGLLPNDTTTFLSSQNGAPRYHVDSKSYAAYAHATYHVTPKLNLIAGARVTYDDLLSQFWVVPAAGFCQVTYAFGAPCLPPGIPSPVEGTEVRHTDLSGRGGLEYHFTDDVMAYFTAARGYKGPTVNNILGGNTPVRPETSLDFEAGVKSELFDRRLVANVSVFHEKFKDFQAQVFDTQVTPPTYIEGNAGGLLSEGVEVNLTGKVTPDLQITGAVTYADTYFTDYLDQCDPGIVCGVQVAPSVYQVAGAALTNAPRWTYTLGAYYRHPLTERFVFDANANWVWKSKVYFAVNDPNTIQPGYGIFNANVGIGPASGAWRLGVFARNLFNKYYVVDIIPTFFDTGGYSNFPDPSGNAFRTVGVSLDVKFK